MVIGGGGAATAGGESHVGRSSSSRSTSLPLPMSMPMYDLCSYNRKVSCKEHACSIVLYKHQSVLLK